MSTVSITTFNCGKLFPLHNKDLATSVINSILPSPEEQFDLLVLGLQEFSYIWECMTPRIVAEQINQVSGWIQAFLGSQYRLITADNTGGTVIFIFGRTNLTVHSLVRDYCPRGVLGSSLKGAITITLQTSNSHKDNVLETYCFICCHLAANEGDQNLNYRITDVQTVLHSCEQNIPPVLFKDSLLFFFGDLNFRVNPTMINNTNNGDELLYLLQSHPLFKNLEEPKLTFGKTYKYTLYDENNVFNDKRTPSWCDRILYRKLNDKNGLNITSYNSLSRSRSLLFTDHQPVRLNFTNTSSFRSIENTVIIKRKEPILQAFNYGDIIIGNADWLRYKEAHYWAVLVVILLIIAKWWFF